EDGIRDKLVTGVQTCALPISPFALSTVPQAGRRADLSGFSNFGDRSSLIVAAEASLAVEDRVGTVVVMADLDPRLDEVRAQRARSEERRVGKECRCRGWR